MSPRLSRDRAELERIRSVYRKYSDSPAKQRIWSLGPAHLFELTRKWSRVRIELARHGVNPAACRALDVGVYTGTDCPAFVEAGFLPESLIAIDVDHASVRTAIARHRWLRALVGSGTRLPFRDDSFDLVYQSTVISSVLDPGRRLAIIREAGRVIRPGGLFISYDMRYPNPWNRHTRPLRRAELQDALAGWEMRVTSLTGIPQIIRPLSRMSLSLCRLVEAVPILRSHLLVVARKP